MLSFREGLEIHMSLHPVDMRKSINGLSALVFDVLSLSPQSGHVFVFYNRARDKVKVLHWDRNGFGLYYKRLEKHRFRIPKTLPKDVLLLTQDQLGWLLAGLDFMLMKEYSELNYAYYY